jgi:hypothetical protein
MSVAKLPAPTDHESVGALFQRLGADVERIVRLEVALVQLRLTAAVDVLRAAGSGIIAASVLGLTGFGVIMAGVVIVLATVIPAWLAAFTVGGTLVVVAAVVAAVEIRVLSHGVGEALSPADGHASPREGRRGG